MPEIIGYRHSNFDAEAYMRESEDPATTYYRERCEWLEHSRRFWISWFWFLAVNYVGALVAIVMLLEQK